MTLLFTYLALAIGVSFLCSILEAVLLSITPSFVAQLEKEKPLKAASIRQVKDNIDHSISSILILNTFAHTMGAAGVGSQAVALFGSEWETLIAVLLTLAILYFSEIIPKTIGATYWRKLAIPSAYLILVLTKLVYPLVWFSSFITRLFSQSEKNEVTREEIIAMASLGHKDGTIIRQENDYLSNSLKLRDIYTEEILTPRSVVHMVNQDMSIKQALDDPTSQQFSRMPVFDSNQDDVVGKVIKQDLYAAERRGRGDELIKEHMQPIDRVSKKLPVQHLLDQFIKQRAHLFLVEDEFGQTAGIVTLEDALETLLGREILDESDQVADMQQYAKDKYRERLRDKNS
ncbi:MAG: hemolysin family protein [Kangiellaceae bacterium]|jgi:CBS domain containing-hemolysin-like protein|nr:hemolysin family protein [Kangiellaceae bacterium]